MTYPIGISQRQDEFCDVAFTHRFTGILIPSKGSVCLKWPPSLPVPEEPLTCSLPEQSCPQLECLYAWHLHAWFHGEARGHYLLALNSTSYGSWLKTTETFQLT